MQGNLDGRLAQQGVRREQGHRDHAEGREHECALEGHSLTGKGWPTIREYGWQQDADQGKLEGRREEIEGADWLRYPRLWTNRQSHRS